MPRRRAPGTHGSTAQRADHAPRSRARRRADRVESRADVVVDGRSARRASVPDALWRPQRALDDAKPGRYCGRRAAPLRAKTRSIMSVFQAKQAAPQGSSVDVAAEMRRGHVGIEDTDRTLLGIFREHLARRASDPPLRIFDICSGSGFFIRRLLRELPDAARHELIAHEDEPEVLPLLQARLGDSSIRIHAGSFCDWHEPIDVLLSWGSFHHMPRECLAHARTLLRPGGLVVLADEFCPEYLTSAMVERVRMASAIHIANGYVLTSDAELAAYTEAGALPPLAVEMERVRQQVLWKWYRHVVDVMMDREGP